MGDGMPRAQERDGAPDALHWDTRAGQGPGSREEVCPWLSAHSGVPVWGCLSPGGRTDPGHTPSVSNRSSQATRLGGRTRPRSTALPPGTGHPSRAGDSVPPLPLVWENEGRHRWQRSPGCPGSAEGWGHGAHVPGCVHEVLVTAGIDT